MYFPLIERRVTTEDRRSHSPERRKVQKGHFIQDDKRNKIVRRTGNDRRIIKLDRETLLLNATSVLIANDREIKEKKSKVVSICSAILIPLTIGVSSLVATYLINNKQIKSAQIIADQQKESAELIAQGQQNNTEKIAAANIENSRTIANAQMETEHLQHLVTIFSSIISPKGEENKKEEVIVQRIRSLAVYSDEALPFLLQIREHFSKIDKNPNNKDTGSSNKNEAATQTIDAIIGYSQLNLSGRIVGSKPDTPVNLRHKKYINYNLNNSHFTNVNLYKANFSGSSLQNSSFTNADLQETIFKSANLKDVTFTNSNLSKTDFRHAYLEGVTFSSNCRNIEYANFSLNTLLKVHPGLLKKLGEDKYALLLMPHEKTLEKINKEEQSKLGDILKILNINTYGELQEKFKALKNKGLTGTEYRTKAVQQVSMNTL